MLWRSLALLSVLILLPVQQGCESKPSKKPSEAPETKKDIAEPLPTPTSDPRPSPAIDSFSFDPIAFLEAGQDTVPVRLTWQTNVQSCQLLLGDQSIDVSGLKFIVVNIPQTIEAQLRCESATRLLTIPVRKKLSVVSLVVDATSEGELIRWDAFGADSCQLLDEENQLNVSVSAAGQMSVKQARSPLNVLLQCSEASGQTVSARYSVAEKLKAADVLKIDAFSGPSEPIRKLSTSPTAPAVLKWASNAMTCKLTYGASTVDVAASGEKTIDVSGGEVCLECYGSRFQTARKSLTIVTRPALEIKSFAPRGVLFGSRAFEYKSVELQVLGADSCVMRADNVEENLALKIMADAQLAQGSTYYVRANIATKALGLTCLNSFGETISQSLQVDVQPRIAIHQFSANPNLITSTWSDTQKRPVTLSWDVENMEFCELKRLSVTDWIPIHRIEPNAAVGQFTIDIDRATEFRLSCRDTRLMVAYRSIEVKWEKQPESSLVIKGRQLQVKAFGFKSCFVQNLDIGYAEKFESNAELLLSKTRTIPLLMEQTKFEMTCSGSNGPDVASSYPFVPSDDYFVLRHAEYSEGELQFEAAWKMRSEAKDCSLYQVKGEQLDLIASGLALQATRPMRIAVEQDETIRMKIICGERNSESSLSASLGTPVAVCKDYGNQALFHVRFDLLLPTSREESDEVTCLEAIKLLGSVERLQGYFLNEYVLSFAPYMNQVKEIVVSYDRDLPSLYYFGKAKKIEIYSDVFDSNEAQKASYALHGLSGLEILDIKLRRFEGLDLRHIRNSHPKLRELRITGVGNNPNHVGSALHIGLRNTNVRSLHITKIDLASPNVAALLDLPLQEFSMQAVRCYESMPGKSSLVATNCLSNLPAAGEKKLIKHLGMDPANIKQLEERFEISKVESVDFRLKANDELSWLPSDKPSWNAYASMQNLRIENSKSLNDFPVLPQVKVLTWVMTDSTSVSSPGNIDVTFPSLKEISLSRLTLGSFYNVWKLAQLERLTLDNSIVKEWDLPLEGAKLATLTINGYPAFNYPAGLKVDRLTLDGSVDPDLPAGMVRVLEYKGHHTLLGQKLLDKYVGKVSTLILSDKQAEPLRSLVQSCELRRESQGTLLVYPKFNELWKACEAL